MATDYFLELFEDVPPYILYSQLYGIANHPIWQIGHLSVKYDHLNESLCGKRLLNWDIQFNTGSRPLPVGSLYPSAEELISKFNDVVCELAYTIGKLSFADLSRKDSHFPTAGDAIIYQAISHTALHTGQLASWRTAHGLIRIPAIFDEEVSGLFECPKCEKRFSERITLSKHLKRCENSLS